MIIRSHEPSAWGLAAISAYRAYNNSIALSFAQTAWDHASAYQIQPDDVAQGFAASINQTIPSSCNGCTRYIFSANSTCTLANVFDASFHRRRGLRCKSLIIVVYSVVSIIDSNELLHRTTVSTRLLFLIRDWFHGGRWSNGLVSTYTFDHVVLAYIFPVLLSRKSCMPVQHDFHDLCLAYLDICTKLRETASTSTRGKQRLHSSRTTCAITISQ